MSLRRISRDELRHLRLSTAFRAARLAFAALTVSTLVGLTTPATAQVFFNPANRHYYEIWDGAYTWTEAQGIASSLTLFGDSGISGHLATVTSQAENDFLVNNLGGFAALNGHWLGGYQDTAAPDYAEPDNGWRWVTGEDWNYTSWFGPYEPNNFGGDENYLVYEHAPGKWNDLADVPRSGFVVEYDAEEIPPGFYEYDPILPTDISGNTFTFTDVPSDRWFDPLSASRFDFQTTDGSLFTGIGFPHGFASPFTVSVGGAVLGQFAPGSGVNFTDYFPGGVSAFSISGINPAVTVGDPRGFPAFLTFDAPTVSFTMTAVNSVAAVPEPGAVAFGLLSAGSLIGLIARKRKS